MRVWLRGSVLALAVAAAACGASDDPIGPGVPRLGPSSPSGILVPLDSGTQWTYDVLDTLVFSGLKPAIDSLSVTMHVLGDTAVDTLHYAILDNATAVFGSELNNPHSYVRNVNGGFYAAGLILLLPQLRPFPASLPPDDLMFPYPALLGGSYEFGIVSVFSIDTVITVPAGTYHCLGYLAAGTTREYVSAGVGLVREEVTRDGDGTTHHTVYQLRTTTAQR